MNAAGLRIGSFAGAAVILDWSVALLAGFILLNALDQGGADALPSAFVWLFAIFISILAHEFAHAATAARLNLKSKQIVLTFFGGHVEFERPPEKRWHDILVSAAGPLANLALFAGVYLATGWIASMAAPNIERGVLPILPFLPPLIVPMEWENSPLMIELVAQLVFLNFVLGVLNLLPGFPLDGGRILSSALSYAMHPARARLIAGIGGIAIAVGLGFWGAQQGLMLTLIVAVFLGLAALAETTFMLRMLARTRD